MGRRREGYDQNEDTKARDFAKYLNEKMEQYGVSVTKLAEKVDVTKKSIYRYKRAENPPTKAIEMEIRLYFQRLEKEMKDREGLRYADEHDLSDEDLELLFYEMHQDELEDELEAHVHEVVTKQVDLLKEGISFYNSATQKYILANFEVYCATTEYDMELVQRISKFDIERRKKVIAYLENIPVDFEMLVAEMDGLMERAELFLRMIRSEDEVPKNKYRQVTADSKGHLSQELYKGFYEKVTEMTYGGEIVPPDILVRIKTMLDYTVNEWYFLFLYERIRRSDTGRGSWLNFWEEGRMIGGQEYMFLNYLKVVAQ